ncbi:unnamed protein product [Trichogramma brassicae]|uniref:PDZ domain-containing protein n=1 Tax=Trichogramma brassicae TaxID=86971 RepID=A0A6H5IRF9_9HYME|nr:unnamed protein product [Trichogramma brassicae]
MELQLSTAETRSLRTTSLDRKQQQQQPQPNGSLLSEAEFVTVVNVHGGPRQQRLLQQQQQQQLQQQSTDVVDGSSFVTVLSIGNGTAANANNNNNKNSSVAPPGVNVDPAHPEEEVQVYRLPGERLGFGLKFEGGNKTSEKVRRLFIQSCAEQSPASRTTCSWGKLGEGDELLSIDGVPVTQLTRLDCVRRLKESQLVLRLLIRCRGALRPEVVSAERKDQHKQVQQQQQCKPTSPPELPTAPPPPVPPRKLRHHHQQQPQKSPASSSSSTVNRGLADGEASPGVKQAWDSPKSAGSSQTGSPLSQGSYRSAASSMRSSNYESCASSPTKSSSLKQPHASPVLNKAIRQELPTEAQVYLDARSHDGSSTQGSTSDDTSSSLSTVVDRCSVSDRFSTTSTISHTSDANQFHLELDNAELEINDREINIPLSSGINVVDMNNADFLLNRLANSEARTYVESRGDVERVTAVVAPNTVLIEETPTLQPPLCFQDAPLSYGHEPRPSIFFTANLVADSRTHFRPIKDDAEIVDKVVNGEAPPLPVRNHVNRVPVNQQQQQQQQHCQSAKEPERSKPNAPRPPKPMPRKEVKGKRKRPPPPPPPPRREPAPPVPEARNPNTINKIFNVDKTNEEDKNQKNRIESETINDAKINDSNESTGQKNLEINQNIQEETLLEILKDKQSIEKEQTIFEKCDSKDVDETTCTASLNANKTDPISVNNDVTIDENKTIEESVKSDSPIDTLEKSEELSSDSETEIVENVDFCREIINHQIEEEIMNEALSIDIDDHSLRVARTIRNIRAREIIEKEDIADESEEDCYWTSNLTTIGEEDETNSLEYENEIIEEKQQLFGSSMTAADNGDKSSCGTTEQRGTRHLAV